MERLTIKQASRLAGLELNSLLSAAVIPSAVFQGASVARTGTPVYDVNGELLFYRMPVSRGKETVGYADMAAHPGLGGPLLSINRGVSWDEKTVLKNAIAAARKAERGLRYDKIRFVAYSFPKLAIQFLLKEKEVLMLEWMTWKAVPQAAARLETAPANFERWSLLDNTDKRSLKSNANNLQTRIERWQKLFPEKKVPARQRRFQAHKLDPQSFQKAIMVKFRGFDLRELHYSTNLADHHPCYELRGQLTNVWCVAASVQMLLDFYRYNYAQTRLATELGLGTLTNPNGLPYSQDGAVVTVLQNMTSNALTANMNTTPNWNEFRDEIRANRPLISFVPGHSRTVAGYVRLSLAAISFRGLLVYDPWPPTTGVITSWENFDTNSYRRTFTAQLTLV
jgi:hypothetical protein